MQSVRLPLHVLSIILVVALQAAVSAHGEASKPRVNNTLQKLMDSVTLGGVREHQAAFQAIADANNGIRAAGSPGYDASVDYIVGLMSNAGYAVTIQPFQFQTFISLSPSILEQVAPPPAGPIENRILSYSGSGDVTAPVTVVPNFGCDASDFAGFPAGNIALIRRGGCTFALKAQNAVAAGAAGVIIYNHVEGVLNGTLGSGFTQDIPVTSVSLAVGQQLAVTPGLVMRLKTETLRGDATSYNVLAETKYGDPSNVVMVGAHLDSVGEGPGIQDNGSGCAAILETALQMAKLRPRNKVRFAWWGAEEVNLIGSTHYVNSLPPDELQNIAVYLNFDMIASPNYVFFVYDGDDSDGVGEGPGPEGSAAIEKVFESYYTLISQPFKGTDLSGRSDYAPFVVAGIPTGGIYTGAEGVKTPEETAIWGGTAGAQYDPCYHQACDTFDNVNLFALEVNADAVAYSVLQFAMNTQGVNGKSGKGNFKPDYWGTEAIQ